MMETIRNDETCPASATPPSRLTLEAFLYGLSKAPKNRLKRRRRGVRCNAHGFESNHAGTTTRAPSLTKDVDHGTHDDKGVKASEVGINEASDQTVTCKRGYYGNSCHQATTDRTGPHLGRPESSDAGCNDPLENATAVNVGSVLPTIVKKAEEQDGMTTAFSRNDNRPLQDEPVIETNNELSTTGVAHAAGQMSVTDVSRFKVIVTQDNAESLYEPLQVSQCNNGPRERACLPVEVTASGLEDSDSAAAQSEDEHPEQFLVGGSLVRDDYVAYLEEADDHPEIEAIAGNITAQDQTDSHGAPNALEPQAQARESSAPVTDEEPGHISGEMVSAIRSRKRRAVASLAANSTSVGEGKVKGKARKQRRKGDATIPAHTKKQRRLPVNELLMVPSVGFDDENIMQDPLSDDEGMLDPIEESLSQEERPSARRSRPIPNSLPKGTRKPLSVLQRNIRLPLRSSDAAANESKLFKDIPRRRKPTKKSINTCSDGFVGSERHIAARIPVVRSQRRITVSSAAELTFELGPIQVHNSQGGHSDAFSSRNRVTTDQEPRPRSKDDNFRGDTRRIQHSDSESRDCNQVQDETPHQPVSPTAEKAPVTPKPKSRYASSDTRVQLQLSSVTAPPRPVTEADSEEIESENEELSDSADAMGEDPVDLHNEFPSPLAIGRANGERRQLNEERAARSRHSFGQDERIKGLHVPRHAVGFTTNEIIDDSDYLTIPGQAARMKSSGVWMEVQEEIDDGSSPYVSVRPLRTTLQALTAGMPPLNLTGKECHHLSSAQPQWHTSATFAQSSPSNRASRMPIEERRSSIDLGESSIKAKFHDTPPQQQQQHQFVHPTQTASRSTFTNAHQTCQPRMLFARPDDDADDLLDGPLPLSAISLQPSSYFEQASAQWQSSETSPSYTVQRPPRYYGSYDVTRNFEEYNLPVDHMLRGPSSSDRPHFETHVYDFAHRTASEEYSTPTKDLRELTRRVSRVYGTTPVRIRTPSLRFNPPFKRLAG